MIIIPAIDLKDGQCVRLRQGLMDDTTVFSDNPVDMAAQWVAQGARRLHLVDLNGAFEGKPMNAASVTQIVSAFPDLPVQIGGGIRNMDIANAYIEAGVSYLIIGTMAVTHPEFVSQLCREFPDQVIVGLDANDGLVATEGWAQKTDLHVVDLSKKFEQDGVSSIVYTDIARDGMMQGVNVEATMPLPKQVVFVYFLMRRQLQFSLFCITQLLRLSKIKRTFVNSPPSNCTHNTVMCLAQQSRYILYIGNTA
jgi:phosphoribosylformimino-5-aminoimidazole carboxamide ribotide isomerase